MMTTKTKPKDVNDPYAPRFAVVGVESGVEITVFHKRTSAFEFAKWHNEHEAQP